MNKEDPRAPGAAPAPAPDQQSQAVAHTGAGAGTALDAMLRTRQMRPKRDVPSEAEPPAAPASGAGADPPGH